MLRPLVVVSIPKAGTHLLTTLLGEWGYQWGGFLSAAGSARTGYWYMLAPPNAHTPASFVIAIEPYHPMTALPVLFIYRHPLDILVSQAYYYASDRTTAWASALEGWDLHERISRLISGTWLFRNLRDRIAGYLGWLDLGNVLPISFEELVGERGGGNKELQVSLIDSLQVRLDIPGNASKIAERVFSERSPTFRAGQIGSHRDVLRHSHYELLAELPQDFLETLGYQVGTPNFFSSRIGEFRRKSLKLRSVELEEIPILIQNDFFGHNIVYFRRRYFGVQQSRGAVEWAKLDASELASFLSGATEEECKLRIAIAELNRCPVFPDDGIPHLVESKYLRHNIVFFRSKYYAVPLDLGVLDLSSAGSELLDALPQADTVEEVKALVAYRVAQALDHIQKKPESLSPPTPWTSG